MTQIVDPSALRTVDRTTERLTTEAFSLCPHSRERQVVGTFACRASLDERQNPVAARHPAAHTELGDLGLNPSVPPG
jgi:hypothetical protein